MKTKIFRWGDSLAVQIPSEIVRDFSLREGSEIEITTRRSATALENVRPEYTLESLLAKITPEALHAAPDWGKSCGRELW